MISATVYLPEYCQLIQQQMPQSTCHIIANSSDKKLPRDGVNASTVDLVQNGHTFKMIIFKPTNWLAKHITNIITNIWALGSV
jgi:hypothetical protein